MAQLYLYPIKPVSSPALEAEIAAAGLPIAPLGVAVDQDSIRIAMKRELAGPEPAELDEIVFAHVPPVPRGPRPLWDIREDILALSGPQISAVWADLSGGTPKKMALDTGPNAAAIWVMEWSATFGPANAQDRNEAKIRVIAFWCQDNPQDLVHPPYDNSINIPGDQPVA